MFAQEYEGKSLHRHPDLVKDGSRTSHEDSFQTITVLTGIVLYAKHSHAVHIRHFIAAHQGCRQKCRGSRWSLSGWYRNRSKLAWKEETGEITLSTETALVRRQKSGYWAACMREHYCLSYMDSQQGPDVQCTWEAQMEGDIQAAYIHSQLQGIGGCHSP